MLNLSTNNTKSDIYDGELDSLVFSLLEISDGALFILKKSDMSIVDCNSAALNLFEASTKVQLVNLPSYRLYNFDSLEINVEKLNNELETTGQYSEELSFRTCKQNVFTGKLVQKSTGLTSLDYIILKVTKSSIDSCDEGCFSALIAETSKLVGRQYFSGVTKLLCQTFNGTCAFIARKMSNESEGLKIFYYHGEAIQSGHIEISGSFIENIMKGYTSFYPKGMMELFPHDKIIQEAKTEGFIGSPLMDGSGAVFGMLGVLSNKKMDEIPDVRFLLKMLGMRASTEIQRLKSKEFLRRQIRELAEINIIKDRLLSIVSNDFQAPLKTILGYSGMLKNQLNESSPAQLANKVKVMDGSLRNLYMLMENISDWSRLHQEKVYCKLSKNNICNIYEDIKPSLKYISDQKGIALINKIPCVLNVMADGYLSRQSIKNVALYVLRNSVKSSSVIFESLLQDGKWALVIRSNDHLADNEEIDFALNSDPRDFNLTEREISIPLAGLFVSREFLRLQRGSLTYTCSEKTMEFRIRLGKA